MRQKVAFSQQKPDLELSRHHHEAEKSGFRSKLHEEDRVEDEEEAGTDEVVDEHEDDPDNSGGHDDSAE